MGSEESCPTERMEYSPFWEGESHLRIESEILDTYLRGESTEGFSDHWIFQTVGRFLPQGELAYTPPDESRDVREAIRRISREIRQAVDEFLPNNAEIWDALFPDWERIVDRVEVNMIVGLPDMFDALVILDPSGDSQVVLDLSNWVVYEGKHNIGNVIHNLLTHELCHVCIGAIYRKIEADSESADYITRIDAMTFNEGFAHLVSYDSTPIDRVDWESETLTGVYKRSIGRLKLALAETDASKQQEYLIDAVRGSYYSKYAGMAGMLFLGERWREGGIPALADEFDRGYHGFAQRIVDNTKNKWKSRQAL